MDGHEENSLRAQQDLSTSDGMNENATAEEQETTSSIDGQADLQIPPAPETVSGSSTSAVSSIEADTPISEMSVSSSDEGTKAVSSSATTRCHSTC